MTILSTFGGGSVGVDTGDIPASLRFRAAASAYLSRTPASAGNRRTWTWSGWVRLGALSANQIIFNQGGVSSNYTLARLNSSNQLDFQSYGAASYNFQKVSSAVFRDPTAWYHVVFVLDATNTQARIYVNGNEVSYSTNTNPANADQPFNQAAPHYIGAGTTPTQYFDGYISRICFVDGQALTPSSFGYQNTEINEWVSKSASAVKAVVDAGGANSFMLDFHDATSLTTLGYDYSSKGNNWTLNNFSLTAGADYDRMLDVPGNSYATLTPVLPATGDYIVSLSKGNLTATQTVNTNTNKARASFNMLTGLWYWEVTATNVWAVSNGGTHLGIRKISEISIHTGETFEACVLVASYTSWAISTYATGCTAAAGNITASSNGAVFRLAFDASNGKLWVQRDAEGWLGGGDPVAGTSPTFYNIPTGVGYCPDVTSSGHSSASNSNATNEANFGQRAFVYTPPTGYKALCQANMPDPAILNPEKHFDVVTYTGTAATKSITGLLFSPGLVEMKSRGRALDWAYYDSVRGVEKRLESNNTDAEVTGDTTGLTAFNSDGWTMGALDQINGTTATNSFVGSAWKAGGAAVTNNAGSISSQVSANVEAGFSIVTYTGTGANATVGHGLGKAPGLILFKKKAGGTFGTGYSDWCCYHAYQNAAPASGATFLNLTSAFTASSLYFNSTAPSTTVFSIGTSFYTGNASNDYVAYCFAEIAGFSKIFSYTGNGSADGPFVHCGFKPKYVLIKRVDVSGSWVIHDAVRSPYNFSGPELSANASTAEVSSVERMDFTAAGFKQRGTAGSDYNTNGGTYIGIAFADVPAKYSLAR